MKKKIAMAVFTVCILVLTIGLMVGCDDKKPDDETDLIVGTWIGHNEEGNRSIYAEITTQPEKGFVWYYITASIVYSGEIQVLTKGDLTLNTKINNRYDYMGNFDSFPHGYDHYMYKFELNGNEKMIVAGEEEVYDTVGPGRHMENRTYFFERTELTIDEFVQKRLNKE